MSRRDRSWDDHLARRRDDNEARRAEYRKRAVAALEQEGATVSAATQELLCKAALGVEYGVFPSTFAGPVEKAARELNNGVLADARDIAAALGRLELSFNGSIVPTQLEIKDRLAEQGIRWADLAWQLDEFRQIVDAMAAERPQRGKQGRTDEPRGAWIDVVWPHLKAAGMEERPAARVIATLFDGTADHHEAVRQRLMKARAGN